VFGLNASLLHNPVKHDVSQEWIKSIELNGIVTVYATGTYGDGGKSSSQAMAFS
jgi:hypothetical protein